MAPQHPSLLETKFLSKGSDHPDRPAESSILHVPSAVFQELHNFIFLSLCTLRIDKSFRNMYNKARNQRSTAEAQERANPADLKQKGARPMVDMEPAQQGQAVGVRWEAKQRLTTNGMFPPYKNTTNTSRSWASTLRYNDNLSLNKIPQGNSNRSAGDGSYESTCNTEKLIWIAEKEFYQCTSQDAPANLTRKNVVIWNSSSESRCRTPSVKKRVIPMF